MSTLRKHGEKWQSIVRVSGHPAIYKSFKSKTDQTLANLEKERTRIDPDYFKGLGTFLPKKI